MPAPSPITPQQLFGDLMYEIYYRFLETEDEYFDYAPAPVPPQGRWRISGVGLPEPVLHKVYSGKRRAADRALRVVSCNGFLLTAARFGAASGRGSAAEIPPDRQPALRFDQASANRMTHEVSGVMDFQFVHQVGAVGGGCFERDAQDWWQSPWWFSRRRSG